jgi:uncharacterized membrane protein YhaH (DUF805 family)
VNNPYAAPQAALDPAAGAGTGEVYEPSLFQLNGRIGRIRYLAYSVGLTLPLLVVQGIVGVTITRWVPWLGGLLSLVLFLGAMVAGFNLARRRLHDLDAHGAWAALLVVPFLNFLLGLWLWFARGTDGPNERGLPPSPTPKWMGFVAIGGFLVVTIGILAAVAIPAYQDYVVKAKAAAAARPGSGF